MTAEDTYRTLEAPTEAVYTEKRSKFLAFALPVQTVEEVKEHLDTFRKRYYDARHVCYAYMLGAERNTFRANDDGEPSGTAGKPILGQIHAHELTDVLIVVVRYFGGVKLGTGGLAAAYKAASALALEDARIVERNVQGEIDLCFEYPFLNEVMRIVKEEAPEVLHQHFDMDCRMTLRIRLSALGRLRDRLTKVESMRFGDEGLP